jgi:hypothetical protein
MSKAKRKRKQANLRKRARSLLGAKLYSAARVTLGGIEIPGLAPVSVRELESGLRRRGGERTRLSLTLRLTASRADIEALFAAVSAAQDVAMAEQLEPERAKGKPAN